LASSEAEKSAETFPDFIWIEVISLSFLIGMFSAGTQFIENHIAKKWQSRNKRVKCQSDRKLPLDEKCLHKDTYAVIYGAYFAFRCHKRVFSLCGGLN
jgi:hypothetical protein